MKKEKVRNQIYNIPELTILREDAVTRRRPIDIIETAGRMFEQTYDNTSFIVIHNKKYLPPKNHKNKIYRRRNCICYIISCQVWEEKIDVCHIFFCEKNNNFMSPN